MGREKSKDLFIRGMKIRFFIISVLIFFAIASSCRTKKITNTTSKKDSIYMSEFKVVIAPVKQSLVYANLCDSLGFLKPIDQTFNHGKVRLRIRTVRDTLFVEQNIDSIVASEILKYKEKRESSVTVEIRYRTPKWMKWYLGISLVIFAWIFFGKWIKSKIPFLKFIKF